MLQREATVLRRERTNTPMQALVTLNDPQYVEAARNLAELAIESDAANMQKRLDYISQRLLSRSFEKDEVEVITCSLDKLRLTTEDRPHEAKSLLTVGESKPNEKIDAVEFAAWTMLVNQLMNLDEVLNK